MEEKEPVNYADIPDPDEDDLDDLDDVLETFKSAKIDQKPAEAQAAKSESHITDTKTGKTESKANGDNDFAAELRAGMSELLGSIQDDPAMQAEFEKLMKGLDESVVQEGLARAGNVPDGPATSKSDPASKAKSNATTANPNENFQDTIKKTMDRMRSSGENASAAAAQSGEEDMLAKMLKEMESNGFPGMNGGSEDDFNNMLMGMMEQLTSKEVLYDPMKELHSKFPDWFEKNASTTKPEDLTRYKEQQVVVAEIVAKFDQPGYKDSNKEDRDYIVERMQKMQAAGSPPPDLVGDMGAAQELMGDLDGGCNQQ